MEEKLIENKVKKMLNDLNMRININGYGYWVENKIEQLEQPFKSILYLKYIRGINLYKMSEQINYSYIHVKRVHIEAIEMYARI